MRCIFCKADSSDSRSVEHILPESLGNVEHVLPAGIVCDSCNNYFASKVEKPVLESEYFIEARFRNMVENKDGKVPPIRAIHPESGSVVHISHQRGIKTIYPADERDLDSFMRGLRASQGGTLVFPVATFSHVDEYGASRFLGKVAIEALAHRFLSISGALDEIVDKTELDPLRIYVRRGTTQMVWPFCQRAIYPEDAVFHEGGYGHYRVLHEYAFLYPSYPASTELYFVLAVFGVEYALNMDAPDITAYTSWLTENRGKSPLHMDTQGPLGCPDTGPT